MSQKLIEIIIMEGIAVLMFLLAYQIGARNRLELIAGYNARTASRVKDKDGLRRLVTRLCVLVGVVSACMPLITYFASAYPYGLAYSIGGYGGFIAGVIGFVMLQSRDYVV